MKKFIAVFLAATIIISLFSLTSFAKQNVNIIDIPLPSLSADALEKAIAAAAQTAEDDLILLHTDDSNNQIHLSSPLVVNTDNGSLAIEADHGITIQSPSTVVVDLQKGNLSLKKITLIGTFVLEDDFLYTVREGENTTLKTEDVLYLINYGNKYFSAEFRIADPDEWAYITGLTQSQKNALLSQIKTLQKGEMTTSSFFIDANKIWTDDKNLCWAAAASNVLEYTGWAEKSGIDFETKYDYIDKEKGERVDFSASDGVLRYFAENFSDKAGNPSYAMQWFINGIYTPSGFASESHDIWAQLKEGSDGGNLFKKIIYEDYISFYYDVQNSLFNSAFIKVAALLRSFSGVSMGIMFKDLSLTTDIGGHAVTLWGYTYNKALEVADKDYITSFYITDSDDNQPASAIDYPKKLGRIQLTWSDAAKSYVSTSYVPGYMAAVSYFSALIPFESVKDIPSSHVTTDASGVDATDGQTSLAEAMTYSELFGGDVTFDESLSGKTFKEDFAWYFASDMLIDASNLAEPIILQFKLPEKAAFLFDVLEGYNVTFKNINIVADDSSVVASAFIVEKGASLELNGCKISGFLADNGAAIYNSGLVSLVSTVIEKNRAKAHGGAIYCAKASGLILGKDCIVAENTFDGIDIKNNIYLEDGAQLSFSETYSGGKAGLSLSSYNPGRIFGKAQAFNEDGSLYFDEKPDYFIDYNEKTSNLFVNTKTLGNIAGGEGVSIEDAVLMFMYVAGKASLKAEQLSVADYNGDSFVDISDAILLFNTVAGKTNG